MKAIVQTGVESVQSQEYERPTPDANEVLIQVHTAGVCGSDVHSYLLEGGYESFPLPRILGHEYSGKIVEIGESVTEFESGDRVVEEPIHDCGECFQCKNGQPNVCQNVSITGAHTDGALANYTTVAERHLHRIPSTVSLLDAATTEPTSIATRAVFTQSRTTSGDHVLVEGPGPIGLLIALVADSMGASVTVSGIDKDASDRLPLLEDLGFETMNINQCNVTQTTNELTDSIGFDVVFDTTGHQSGIQMGAKYVRRGGQIVVVGLPGEPSELFFTPIVRGEIDLNTSYGSTWRNFEQALRLMETGAVTPSEFSDIYSVDNPAKAFTDFIAAETCKPIFRFADADTTE